MLVYRRFLTIWHGEITEILVISPQAEENLSETQELGESDAEVASQGADGWGVPWRAPKNMAGEGDFMRNSYGI